MSGQETEEFVYNWNQTLDTIYPPRPDNRGHDWLVARTQLAVEGVFTPILCVLGMVGNVLAVVTWMRPALRSSTGRFLSAQAVVDFGVLLMWLMTVSARRWFESIDYHVIYAAFFSYVGLPFYHFFVHCSVWLTLAITIERYIMVCWPTHAKHLCGERQANVGVLVIVISSLVGNIPHFLMYGVAWGSTGHDVINSSALQRTSFGTGLSSKVYGLYISCISLIAMPWFTVLFFNYKIVSQIASSNRRMLDKKSSEASLKAKKTEWQITRLLLVVTFTYLSVMGPYCLIQIAIILHAQGIDPHHRDIAIKVTKAGYVLNSSLNFILYCMMGRRFRRELKTMLGMKLSDSDMTSVYTSSTNTGDRSGDSKNSVNGVLTKK